jgi:hypothetical protein
VADTAYDFPIGNAAQRERAADVLVGVGQHLIVWLQAYNIRLRSIVVDEPANTITFTFSDPIPKAERDHIRLTIG